MTAAGRTLSRLALEGLMQAMVHAETMMACDPETYGPDDWKSHEAAERWLDGVLKSRGLVRAANLPVDPGNTTRR
jgi:hypothetical protein